MTGTTLVRQETLRMYNTIVSIGPSSEILSKGVIIDLRQAEDVTRLSQSHTLCCNP